MLAPVDGTTTQLNLVIETGSDPIAGLIGGPDVEPRTFSGWIELVDVIETARAALVASMSRPACRDAQA
jgi:hypothetical protein